MLEAALSIGVSYDQYWNMTLDEIITYIKVYTEKEENRAKEILLNNYNLASLIATFIFSGLTNKEPPSIEKLYPKYFDVPEEVDDNSWKLTLAQMDAFAIGANRQRAKK